MIHFFAMQLYCLISNIARSIHGGQQIGKVIHDHTIQPLSVHTREFILTSVTGIILIRILSAEYSLRLRSGFKSPWAQILETPIWVRLSLGLDPMQTYQSCLAPELLTHHLGIPAILLILPLLLIERSLTPLSDTQHQHSVRVNQRKKYLRIKPYSGVCMCYVKAHQDSVPDGATKSRYYLLPQLTKESCHYHS